MEEQEKFHYFDDTDKFIDLHFTCEGETIAVVFVDPCYLNEFIDNLTACECFPVSWKITYQPKLPTRARVFEDLEVSSYVNAVYSFIKPVKGLLGDLLEQGYRGCHCQGKCGYMTIGFIYYHTDIDEIIERLLECAEQIPDVE